MALLVCKQRRYARRRRSSSWTNKVERRSSSFRETYLHCWRASSGTDWIPRTLGTCSVSQLSCHCFGVFGEAVPSRETIWIVELTGPRSVVDFVHAVSVVSHCLRASSGTDWIPGALFGVPIASCVVPLLRSLRRSSAVPRNDVDCRIDRTSECGRLRSRLERR